MKLETFADYYLLLQYAKKQSEWYWEEITKQEKSNPEATKENSEDLAYLYKCANQLEHTMDWLNGELLDFLFEDHPNGRT